LIKRET